MIRRKGAQHLPHPNYGGSDFLYTLKLKHGGLAISNLGKMEYLEGTISVFDFVDIRNWSLKYLEGLCEQLGYMKSKQFYVNDKNDGKLKEVVCEHDIWLVIMTAEKHREFTKYLESEKSYIISGEKEIEGDVSFLEVLETTQLETKGDDLHDKEGVDLEVENGGADLLSNSEDDDEYSQKEDSCDELLDDIMFYENIDKDVEWVGTRETNEQSSDSNYLSDNASQTSEFDSVTSDNDEIDGARKVMSASGSLGSVLELSQIFSTKDQFKEVVNNYSVQNGRATKFIKNDARRIYARCKKLNEGCNWHINALKVKDELSFQIREIDLAHTCARTFHVDNAKSGWLAKRFERSFRADPKRSVKGFRNSAISELAVYISPQQAIRTRQKILKMIDGNSSDQYSKLWDYAETLREKNPGSTVILQHHSMMHNQKRWI